MFQILMVGDIQLCYYHKFNQVIYREWMNFIACKLYFNVGSRGGDQVSSYIAGNKRTLTTPSARESTAQRELRTFI